MIIPALRDRDGDYWIAYGSDAASLICLTREGYISPGTTAYPSAEFGPFEKTYLEIGETAYPKCEHCG